MSSKRKHRAVFRVDANPKIGLGHFVRCLAIAETIREEFLIVFAIQNPLNQNLETLKASGYETIYLPENQIYEEDAITFINQLLKDDIIVLDGLVFDTEYQKIIKERGFKIISIDDLRKYHFLSDVIINRDPSVRTEDYDAEPYTKFYIGIKYAMLRRQFIEQAIKKRDISEIETVFICIGGTDPLNLTPKMIHACLFLKIIKRINVIVNPSNNAIHKLKQLFIENSDVIHYYSELDAEQMIAVMLESQIAICPASSLAYEVFCVGLNLITGFFVDDQKTFSKYIQNHNLGISVGDFRSADIIKIIKGLELALESKHYLKQKELVKSESAINLRAIFEDLIIG